MRIATKSPAGRACVVVVTMMLATGLVAHAPSSRAAPSRAELERAEQRLMEIERDFELVVERYNLVDERLQDIRIEIGTAELEVKDLQERMGVREQQAVDLATQLYKDGPAAGFEQVLGATSLVDIERRVSYMQSSQDAQTKVFERLSVAKDTLAQKLDVLEQAQSTAVATQRELAGLRDDIEGKVADQKDEITELTAAIDRAEDRRARRAAAAAAAQAALGRRTVVVDGIEARPAPAPNPGARAAVEAALSQIGKPYVWAAEGPDSYDCSGLTLWAWAHAGVSLPHNSGMQYAATPRVDRSDWQPGDLLFFGSPIHHVAMYIGNGQMVEAPYSGSHVRVNSAHRPDYVGAGRPGV